MSKKEKSIISVFAVIIIAVIAAVVAVSMLERSAAMPRNTYVTQQGERQSDNVQNKAGQNDGNTQPSS